MFILLQFNHLILKLQLYIKYNKCLSIEMYDAKVSMFILNQFNDPMLNMPIYGVNEKCDFIYGDYFIGLSL